MQSGPWARLLWDAAAKRRILARLTDERGEPYGPDEAADIRDFASVYADHADFQQEWWKRVPPQQLARLDAEPDDSA